MAKRIALSVEEVFATYNHTLTGETSFIVSEHALVYVARGSMDVMIDGHLVSVVQENECIFVRKGHRMTLVKYPSESVGYQFTVVLFFPRRLLFDFYKTLTDSDIPYRDARSKKPVVKIAKSATLISLFDSFRPYWVAGDQPNEDWLKMKVLEAIRFLYHSDSGVFASLFDFTSPWRLDIIDFMEKNYMYDLTVEELARYTGRSVATFKRDFSKVSELSPRNWLIRRRLEAAHQLLLTTDSPINRILTDVGFKNFSHFSKVYRAYFGVTPSETRQKRT